MFYFHFYLYYACVSVCRHVHASTVAKKRIKEGSVSLSQS